MFKKVEVRYVKLHKQYDRRRIISKTALNDVTYNFEPLKLYAPDPNYKVDEAELQKSIQKSQEFISFIQDYKKRKGIN